MEYTINHAGVYILIHKPTNKSYVGHGKVIRNRRNKHLHHLRNNTHDNPILQALWNKTRESQWEFRALVYCDEHNMRFYEQKALDSGVYGQLNVCKNAYKTNQWTIQGKESIARSRRGENSPSAKLTEEDIVDIRSLAGVISDREIAKQYSLSFQHVSDIINHKKWKHVGDKAIQRRKIKRSSTSHFSDDQIRYIRKRIKNGETCQAIANEYNVARSIIAYVRDRKTYKDVSDE